MSPGELTLIYRRSARRRYRRGQLVGLSHIHGIPLGHCLTTSNLDPRAGNGGMALGSVVALPRPGYAPLTAGAAAVAGSNDAGPGRKLV